MKAVEAAMEKVVPRITGTIQSAKDRTLNEITTRASREAAMITERITKRLKEQYPDAADKIELEAYKLRDETAHEVGNAEAANAAQQAQAAEVRGSLTALLTDSGISPDDKRLDWGLPTDTYVSGLKKFNASVSRIIKEERGKPPANLETMISERIATMRPQIEAEIRKSLGVDTVPPLANSNTAPATDDTAWLKQWSEGTLPATKDNVAKAERLLK